MDDQSSELQRWLNRMKAGDPSARDRVLECAQGRLSALAWKMLKGFPGVRRWEDVEDVVQQAALKLWNALHAVNPGSVREFVGLAATQVRRVLIDMARHYYGPQGPGTKHQTPGQETRLSGEPADSSQDPRRLAAWTAFHEHVETLPEAEREVFDLHWYQGLTHAEAGNLLGVSLDTVKRRWQSARLQLYQALHGQLPEA
jgi:RNA polymerase sigma-70 factor (ECF subfamily)